MQDLIATGQRVPATHCAKCRKPLKAGDRVSMVFIVQKTGANPRDPREMGATVGDEFELAHHMCENPGLNPGLVIV